uniref:Uncharacterized protein n=1 Tax=Marseillevirus LCMAC101 TaxID=2506602 RepID=A0A481YU52_9VIRU|nr:MAG: hypothetical protein LCMAC101_06490 [Marseillevirus LCMAC101]
MDIPPGLDINKIRKIFQEENKIEEERESEKLLENILKKIMKSAKKCDPYAVVIRATKPIYPHVNLDNILKVLNDRGFCASVDDRVYYDCDCHPMDDCSHEKKGPHIIIENNWK